MRLHPGLLLPPILGLLVGVSVGLLSPVGYRSTATLDAASPGGFAVPYPRHDLVLQRAIRRDGEADRFVGCLDVAAADAPPPAAELFAEPADLRSALRESGLEPSLRTAAHHGVPSLGVNALGDRGYVLAVIAPESDLGEPLLQLLARSLRCWVEDLDLREPTQRAARLVEELERIRQEAGEVPTLPVEAAARLDEIRRIPALAGPPEDPTATTADAAALLGLLEDRPAGALPVGVDREELRGELIGLAEQEAMLDALRSLRDLHLRQQIRSAWARTYRLPERLPIPGDDLEVRVLDRRLRLRPPVNTGALGLVAGLVLSWATAAGLQAVDRRRRRDGR